jgi:hypothetical protein
MTAVVRYWMGPPPLKCEACSLPITHRFHDARLKAFNCWGNVCDGCHEAYGFGHGTGNGQQYERQPDGRWMKTKG